MNLKLHFSLIFVFLLSYNAVSQCTPGDSISCPDPENNGQICPDTIAPAYKGLDYKQEITFLAPSRIDTLSLSIDIHHITLVSIDGLPEGIDWETNAENDEFFPEIYYCILFAGNTNVDSGFYPITIVIDVYTLFLGEPVKVVQIEDSTSLSMRVLNEPSAIGEQADKMVSRIWPNPFENEFSLEMNGLSGLVEVELINILGERVHKQVYNSPGGLYQVKVDASFLPEGIYFVRLINGDRRRSYMVSKRQ